MNIRRLSIRNFKRLTGLDIVVDADGLIVIGGNNAQGKSSVLDGIAFLLGGPKFRPTEPLHRGADKGEIVVEFDGGITVKRTMNDKGGGSLRIATSDGMSPRKPQAWLDERLGALTFDPLAFMRLSAKEQAKAMRDLTGCDTTELDAARKAAYNERRDIGRDGKRAAAHADQMPHYPDVKPVDVAALLAEQAEAERKAATVTATEQQADGIERDARALHQRVEVLRENAETAKVYADPSVRIGQIDSARVAEHKAAEERRTAAIKAAEEQFARDIATADHRANDDRQAAERAAAESADRAANLAASADELEAEAKSKAAECDATRTKAAEMRAALPDADAIRQRIANAGSVNAKAEANERKAAAEAEAEKLRTAYAGKSAEIDEIDTKRRAMLESVTFPVEGLGFGDDGLTFNGLPLAQASQAEQIRIGMEIALASDPQVRIALIRDGSLLDDEHMQLVAEIAAKSGAQVWVERVGDRDDGAIIIEDGAIRA